MTHFTNLMEFHGNTERFRKSYSKESIFTTLPVLTSRDLDVTMPPSAEMGNVVSQTVAQEKESHGLKAFPAAGGHSPRSRGNEAE